MRIPSGFKITIIGGRFKAGIPFIHSESNISNKRINNTACPCYCTSTH